MTGALTQVSSKTIRERPVQNALQAMQGKAAGVQITSNNRPGELGDVRIRGSRSLNASNDPLYVIDGIPMSVGSMADVNPNDIESMEILKMLLLLLFMVRVVLMELFLSQLKKVKQAR